MAASRCAWVPMTSSPTAAMAKGSIGPSPMTILAPYYDKAEAFIGVFGSKEGLENTPDSNSFNRRQRRAAMRRSSRPPATS